MARQERAPLAFDSISAQATRAAAGLNIESFSTFGDANYVVLPTDRVVSTSVTLTASRSVTLPAANAVNPGTPVTILDGIGTVGARVLIIVRAGTDTIDGGAGSSIVAQFGSRTLISDGVSAWTTQVNNDRTPTTRGGTGLAAIGAANTVLRSNGSALAYAALIGPAMFLLPTGAIAQTVPRHNAGTNFAALVSAQLLLVGIWLPADTLVSTITFVSGTTALVTGVNQWFALYNSARGKLAVTADDTSTAWGAATAKTLTISGGFTTTYEGLHYVGCMVKATTVPSLVGVAATPATKDIAPILSGLSSAGLTNPASAPATAAAITTGQTAVEYAYVS